MAATYLFQETKIEIKDDVFIFVDGELHGNIKDCKVPHVTEEKEDGFYVNGERIVATSKRVKVEEEPAPEVPDEEKKAEAPPAAEVEEEKKAEEAPAAETIPVAEVVVPEEEKNVDDGIA